VSRRAVVALNVAAALAAFALAAAAAIGRRGPSQATVIGAGVQTYARRPTTAAAAETAGTVVGADGHAVPIRRWQRIVSTSWLGDSLLLELCEPDRVLAYTDASRRDSVYAYRFAGKPTIEGLGGLEPILSMGADLVLVNSLSDPGRVTKLREAGVEVLDVGGLRGLASVIDAAEKLARVLGAPERGVSFGRALAERMARVAAPLGDRPRRRGLYVTFISGHLFGGTRGTSYHDVLSAAGLVDVAADRFEGWPEYSTEQVLELAPDVVVMKAGGRAGLCAHPALGRLAACGRADGVLELPGGLLEDPGPAMLLAAEALFRAAYPQRGTAPHMP
jgi:iron complex transport system substrate-binding protein